MIDRWIAALAWVAVCGAAPAQSRRIVVIKLDGVPAGLMEEVLHEKDARTGKSRLPWIEEVFGRQGVRLANFYVRGISLSAPSWAMLDTGQHQRIHGNVEYDRFTLQAYDYLNFFPFYTDNAEGKRADMPGVEVLDASGVPLVVDRFTKDERYQSFQLYQRWISWKTLQLSFQNRFLSRSPRELFDEWQTGFELSSGITEQTERELIADLADSRYQYLDYFSGDFDHLAHLSNERSAQVGELQRIDATVGRVWTAIRKSPLAEQTVLAMVSDHGINSTEGAYSQGYSFVDWFRSPAGGANHTATDRYPLTEFKIRGLNAFVSEVITPSSESAYLKGEAEQYPTVYLDVDGNERAAVQLRNSDLNTLHILLKQMERKDVPARIRAAASETFFEVLDSRRAAWQHTLTELHEELGALRRAIARQRSQPKRKLAKEEARRLKVRLVDWEQDERSYSEYVRVMSNLLALRRGALDPHARIEELIPKRSLGEPNTLFDLQNYTVGPSAEGLIVSAKGNKLDEMESFHRMNYLAALRGITVRNSVQKGVGSRPVDFVAARIPEGVLLYSDDDHEAIVESRTTAGRLELRYLPVAALHANSDGKISWSDSRWKADLPLRIWEDPELQLPDGANRETWLSEWHTDREWLEATHRTRYSNGIIGIHEQFLNPEPLAASDCDASPEDQVLLKRFEWRRRRLVEPDLVVLANDHWNFNVRGFNPGGNHGSFFRISTHSILLFAGGAETGVPRGLVIDAPYDSLSFAPTLLKLAGKDITGMPGPVIGEVLPH